jgi:hypothetical protein
MGRNDAYSIPPDARFWLDAPSIKILDEQADGTKLEVAAKDGSGLFCFLGNDLQLLANASISQWHRSPPLFSSIVSVSVSSTGRSSDRIAF